MDSGRKFDLEEVATAIKNARTQSEREHYEHLGYRLINETTTIRSLRDELVKAMRANDIRKVARITQHIQYIRAEETNGVSWGNDKGNKKRFN